MNEQLPNDHTQHDEDPRRLDGLLLDFRDLLPGDILLFRAIEPDSLARRVSRTIRSPYTHSGIYVGGEEVLEAGDPKVEVRRLSDLDKKENVIGVFRSQMGFLDDRIAELRKFADTLVRNDAEYDWTGIRNFRQVKNQLEQELLEILDRDYGKVLTKDELERRSYFCSALVVACYIVCGVIGDTAQLAYKADAFSPADLHEDPTFGWFLGYITSSDNAIPSNDPLLGTTLWRDVPARRWWAERE
jgi:hypothetical protein